MKIIVFCVAFTDLIEDGFPFYLAMFKLKGFTSKLLKNTWFASLILEVRGSENPLIVVVFGFDL
jgi:hypothetical protein